jgi:hypothetical protein
MKRLVLAAALLCASSACGGAPTPPPFKPDPYEPAPAPTASACERFCALIDRLDCPGQNGSPGQDEQRGTADDVPCTRVCEDVLSKGTYQADSGCLSTASNCEAAETCLLGP